MLQEPVEKWPICDCLIAFHSRGFPLEKSIEYAKLRYLLYFVSGCGVAQIGCGLAHRVRCLDQIGWGAAQIGCGVAQIACDVVPIRCGVLQTWCGVAQMKCGEAQIRCGVAQIRCGVAKIGCDVAQIGCIVAQIGWANSDEEAGDGPRRMFMYDCTYKWRTNEIQDLPDLAFPSVSYPL